MKQYQVTGMSCAACQARVEKAVSKVPGVTSCAVSLLTNSMGVEGDASEAEIIKAVTDAGYGASPKQGGAIKKTKRKADGITERAAEGIAEGAAGDGGARGFERSDDRGGSYSGTYGDAYSTPYSDMEESLKDHETPVLKKRLIASLGFLIILMYFSMGHMMWGWPLPAFFQDNHVAMGLIQMLLAGIVMVINQKFFINGFRGLIHGAPNMDTLVALGSMASFGWSVYALFAMTGAQARGDQEAVMKYMMEFYFESAAMILTLITVGKMLEARSKGKTTDALKGLMRLAPKRATIIKDGTEIEIPAEDLNVGDIFVVRPGENIPVDGVVIEGMSAIDEAALTGESIPVEVTKESKVSAATTNLTGFIKCQATRVGEDTTLSQIIKMVSDAAATKAPIAKVADKVSGVFVPVVIGIAAITTIIWLLVGKEPGFALARGISVLVISCPCALGLATPVAIMVGSGLGAKKGILYKTAVSLEETGKAGTVVLDKTGTITKGEPRVTDLLTSPGIAEEELITLAASLESKSEHPLAKAVMELSEERGIKPREVDGFQILPGNGLKGRWVGTGDSLIEKGEEKFVEGLRERPLEKPEESPKKEPETQEEDISEIEIFGGSQSFVEGKTKIPADVIETATKLSEEGKTCLFFCQGERLLGLIAVADVIKEESPEAIGQLQDMGLKVVMLTGDNERTAQAIGRKAGVNQVIAGVLPDGKEKVIRKLQEEGKVIMVGDGINDAPALTRADIGMAIGAGADIAMDAADIVLVNSKLSDVPAAIRLSKETLKNIHQNLFWAFIYNIIGIPVAAGAFIKAFGLTLNPMLGAAAMSLSSFFVVTNALRLNLFNPHDSSKYKGKSNSPKEMELKESYGEPGEEKSGGGLDKPRGVKPGEGLGEPREAKLEEGSGMSAVAEEGREETISETNKAREIKTRVIREEEKMKKTMTIEGMMCMHCEAAVKKALEAIEGVGSAEVSHEKGTAVVTLNAEVADETLKTAVEEKEYVVKGIE